MKGVAGGVVLATPFAALPASAGNADTELLALCGERDRIKGLWQKASDAWDAAREIVPDWAYGGWPMLDANDPVFKPLGTSRGFVEHRLGLKEFCKYVRQWANGSKVRNEDGSITFILSTEVRAQNRKEAAAMIRKWREVRRQQKAECAAVGIDAIDAELDALSDQVDELERKIIVIPARTAEGMARKLAHAVEIIELDEVSDVLETAVRSTYADLLVLGGAA